MPKKEGEKKPKTKANKKSTAQSSTPVSVADKGNDQGPTHNANASVKEENSQEEGLDEKTKKVKKKASPMKR